MFFLYIFFIIGMISLLKFLLNYRFTKCGCTVQMEGKVALVTGSESGVGYETAKRLAMAGARVIITSRHIPKGRHARARIVLLTGNNDVLYKYLDLSQLDSVRRFAVELLASEGRLDILIHNEEIVTISNTMTDDNLPVEAQVNYFAPFLLTVLLLPLLRASAPSRIINVSSAMHCFGKIDALDRLANGIMAHARMYCNTKLALILFTNKLSRKMKLLEYGVTVNCVNPGLVNSDMFGRHLTEYSLIKMLVWLVFKTPLQAAQTIIHVALAPQLEEVSGAYFEECAEATPSKRARDNALADKLWEQSMNQMTRGSPSPILYARATALGFGNGGRVGPVNVI